MSENSFDSSDEENCDEEIDAEALHIDWLDLLSVGCEEQLGLCALPGCKFKDTWRSLTADIGKLKTESVQEAFVLCTRGELKKYRVPDLLECYAEAAITVHHIPFPDGSVPSMDRCVKLLDELQVCLMEGRKTIIHCFGGVGRTCLVAACLMLRMDESFGAEAVMSRMRELRGNRAIQTVKQYNFIMDFVKNLAEYEKDEERRSISR